MNQENPNISCNIDYHIHTMLCNHAKYGMEAYINKAVLSGLDEICFLDHLTISEPGNRHSMAPSEVPFYFQAVQNLKIRYRKVINLKVGLEIDYHPDHIALINNIIEPFSFDVIGSSLHFPKGVDVVSHKSDWSKGGLETNEIYRIYFEYLDKMIDNNYFDFICHIDLMKKFGRDLPDCFEKELDEIIKKIAKNNIVVEVNTSGYDHNAQNAYPSIDILKKCCKYGVEITIGSDAHEPDHIGRHYEKVLPLICSAGYKQVCVFNERKRSFIQISAK